MKKSSLPLLAIVIIVDFLSVTSHLYASKNQPKNIIFFMADDLGIGDISHFHRQRTNVPPIVDTPNMDALFEKGVTFTQAYTAAALCAPTRYAVATGRYPTRSTTTMGDWTFTKPSTIVESIKTVGHAAQEAGYRTSFFGKYSLGGTFYQVGNNKPYLLSGPHAYYQAFTTTPDYPLPDVARGMRSDLPASKGFDYSFVSPSGHQAPPHAFFEDGQWWKISNDSTIVNLVTSLKYNSDKMKNITVQPENMLGDRGSKANGPGPENHGIGDSHWDSRNLGVILCDKALAFIESNKDKPFFMAYHALGVHLPHTPPKTWRGKPLAGTHPHPHLDMVKELDYQLGDMVALLKKLGIYDDTLIIFTSDNGGLSMKGEHTKIHMSNHTDRGFKCVGYEGGFHVPFTASWPRGITKAREVHSLLSTTDLMATIYDLSGRKMPAKQGLDSISFWPQILSDKSTPHRDNLFSQGLFKSHWRGRVIRKGDFKLILGEKQGNKGNMRDRFVEADYFPEGLFDLANDPQENTNLVKSPEYKNKIQELHQLWKDYLISIPKEERMPQNL